MPRSRQYCKQKALKEAMKLFTSKGFHGTSMQELVDALGMNRASIYNEFRCKEALFQEALSEYLESNRDKLKASLQSIDNKIQAFEQLLIGGLDSMIYKEEGPGCFAVNTTTSIARNNPGVKTILRENQEQIEKIFSTELEQGQDYGNYKLRYSPEETARIIYTLYSGLMVIALNDTDQQQLNTSTKQSLELLFVSQEAQLTS